MADLAGEGRVNKRFRVAREGQTVDGRLLSRKEIQEIADTYHPNEYGARINIEHLNGYSPEPPFNAYGDVISADAVEENGMLCLYNTISGLPNLQKINKAGQKIYPSIEFIRDYADTGKAYQVGLGMTDTPASRGTQPLKFTHHHPILSTIPDSEIYFMSTTPTSQSTNQVADQEKGILSKIAELMSGKKPDEKPVEVEFNQIVTDALTTMATTIGTISKEVIGLKTQIASIQTTATQATAVPAVVVEPAVTTASVPTSADQFTTLSGQLSQLITVLSTTPANPAIPPITGAGAALTSF